jgi:hypothetical protein
MDAIGIMSCPKLGHASYAAGRTWAGPAVCPAALAFVANLAVAMIVFGLGGLVWAPFTPVAYSFLRSGLGPHEQ